MRVSKRGQFYLIAAIIIIIILLSLAAVKNYASVKKRPARLYSMSDVLDLNGRRTIENALYNNMNVSQHIDEYLRLFSNYLESNTNIDFNLIIIYGGLNGEIMANGYSRASLGTINAYFPFLTQSQGGTSLEVQRARVDLNENARTANITLEGTYENLTLTDVRLLEDNNFIFMITTNEEFENYVISNVEAANMQN